MELDLIRVFVKVVQHGSFAKGAQALKMPRSTVSKSISRLERETGTKLLLRSTRSLAVTQTGQTFYEASLGPIQALENAESSLYGQDNLLTGTVRITAPEDLGTFVIAPAVTKLSALHSLLRFELVYTDQRLDLIKEGFDLGVRIGPVRDSGLKLRRVGETVLILVASPGYLSGCKNIRTPYELSRVDCVTLNLPQTAERWSLRSANKTVQVPIKPKILINQMSSVLRTGLEGGGIALVPQYLCQPQLKNGQLIRVLPKWSSSTWPISLVSPLAPSSSARLKVTVDAIFDELKAAKVTMPNGS